MNLWNTDFCHLKLKVTLSVYVLLSQGIMKLTCLLLLPLAETTARKIVLLQGGKPV